MNTPRLFARPQIEPRGWHSELALRYGAATLVTLVALAAAQLVLPTKFMLMLGVITLLGVPVSLLMRLHDMRIAGWQVPRPLWNALTVTASVAASAVFLRVPLRNMLGVIEGGMSDTAMLRVGATEPMLLLIQLFLVFAAFRSFSLISDKDATLATVPSFSVLLLLIPVYPNIEVVCYFLAWTLVATMLFALDHRSEIHEKVTATVPAPAPGQEVKLAARSLAGVLGISLVAAISLSGLLTARDPRESSSSDSAISLLATRITQFSLQNEDTSTATGPQRQIDFSSGTSLPTRAKLWTVTTATLNGQAINPDYWRLFTLSDYNGSTWSQNQSKAIQRQVRRALLTRQQWPPFTSEAGTEIFRGEGGFGRRRRDLGSQTGNDNGPNGSGRGRGGVGAEADQQPAFGFSRDYRREGFALSEAQPQLADSFGNPTQTVRYWLTSERTTLGFLPLLPAPRSLVLSNSEQENLAIRADGAVDVSIIAARQVFRIVSQVPALPEYGIKNGDVEDESSKSKSIKSEGPPLTQVKTGVVGAPILSAAERAANLALPAKLPVRVREFGRNATKSAETDASNYARAQLLASATQNGAIYTLRPPAIPTGRDAADFFLFESRRGYCTYFAGALTVLCRTQGIPARVVSGFVSPDHESAGQSIIRDANAHAWTEVWVENWGWAPVDATPPDDRGDNSPTFLENWSDLIAAQFDLLIRWSLTHWPLVIVGGALLFGALGSWRFRGAMRRRLGRTIASDTELQRREIAADYARVARDVARRFRPRAAWETPDEWLRAAHAEVPQLPFEPLQTLTELYVRARFSPRELSADAAQQAHKARARVVWPKKPWKQSRN